MIRLRSIGNTVDLTAAKGAAKVYAYSRNRRACVILHFPK
jgi:hypothetical protein